MTFDKEFKEAISQLPAKEKDKLILRLLKKDPTLANRLYFELIDTSSVDEKRAALAIHIQNAIERFSQYNNTPGYIMMYMRDISGEINEHVKVTKDRFGEISLNLQMLIQTIHLNNEQVLSYTLGKARKFCLYVISRTFKILVLRHKLHEDLWIELDNDLEELGGLIVKNSHLLKIAIQNGLDVNWLLNLEIPENIVEIHKDIKNQGFLKTTIHLSKPNYKAL